MSNAKIIQAIFNACDQFERKEIELPDFQIAIEDHASAIEGLDSRQTIQIRELCNRLEEIEFEVLSEHQESRAREVITEIRAFFSQWPAKTPD